LLMVKPSVYVFSRGFDEIKLLLRL